MGVSSIPLKTHCVTMSYNSHIYSTHLNRYSKDLERCSESRRSVQQKNWSRKALDGCGPFMAPKVKRSEWKAPPYRARRDCWVPSLDHPGYSRPERAWMLTSFSASQKHPQSSPWPQGAVSPFPSLLLRLASSFSFASQRSPNYSSSKQ